MQFSRPVAILIGVFTAWPIAYMFFFFAFIFGSFMRITNAKEPAPLFKSFRILMVAHAGTMLVMLALLVFYIVHVFKSPALTGDRRILWAVVLFMGGPIAMPIYWFLYVWRGAHSSGASPSPFPPAPGAV
jgi:hypothetical protein